MNSRILNSALAVIVLGATLAATWLLDGHKGVITATPPSAPAALSAQSGFETAPPVTLRALDGTAAALHDYKGKIVLLNFWATWCTPCIAEWPQFIKLAQAMPDDLVILTISIDDDQSKILPFMARYVPDYRVAANIKLFHDTDKSVSQDLFQTVRVPETIIITPEMTMARKVAGLSLAWDSDDTKAYLRSLLED